MPLKLIPPRKGKSPNWSIRGTYLKVYVDRSCGTDRKALARKILHALKGGIERGEYPEKPAQVADTFLSAAVAYMKAGGERVGMARLINYFGETPLPDIDQQAIDDAAVAIYPAATPATRNRWVYTPVSAVMRHRGFDKPLRRPKGAKGQVRTDFMQPEDAGAIIAGADSFDREFGTFLMFLLFTGARRNEPFQLQVEHVDLDRASAIFGRTKNGSPRSMRLASPLLPRLAELIGERKTGRVFRFRPGGGLKDKLLRAKLAAEGRDMPKRVRGGPRRIPAHRYAWVTFHIFRHTFATWLRMFGGADLQGLVATDNWKDLRSAARYAHVVPQQEWGKVESFPELTPGKSVESRSRHG